MGFAKRLDEEQAASGFSTGRHFDNVCGLCIDDPALTAFVAKGRISMCDFCGSTNELGMEVGNLFQYMAECLAVEWDDPINEVAWEGGFVDPPRGLFDSDDLLGMVDEPLGNENLRQEFIDSFDHLWCQQSPYSLEPWEALLYSWSEFAEVVKKERRFLTTLDTTVYNLMDNELLTPAKVLDAIGDAILRSGQRMLKRTTDLRIVRARAHDPDEILDTSRELGSPPLACAEHNRMSGVGISMFYGAENEMTAIREVQASSGQTVTVGVWKPTRELVYLDLLAARPIPSIFDNNERMNRVWLRFLVGFADELAKPVDDDDNKKIQYIPTQIVTEYIRDHLKTSDGSPIDAIRYRSAWDEQGVCWVVFAGPDDCGSEGDSDEVLLMLKPKSIKRYDWVLQQV